MRYVLTLALLFITFAGRGQKIAKYTAGMAGTEDYQEISFWSDKRILVKNGDREQPAIYQGSTVYANERAFLLLLPGNIMVRVQPNDEGKLFITGLSSKYYKTFTWVHGGGTVDKKGICATCTLNEKEALKLLHANFF